MEQFAHTMPCRSFRCRRRSSSLKCSGACDPGTIALWAQRILASRSCPAGRFVSVPGSNVSNCSTCKASSTAKKLPYMKGPARAGKGTKQALESSRCSGHCPPGFFCPSDRSTKRCPQGTFSVGKATCIGCPLVFRGIRSISWVQMWAGNLRRV